MSAVSDNEKVIVIKASDPKEIQKWLKNWQKSNAERMHNNHLWWWNSNKVTTHT